MRSCRLSCALQRSNFCSPLHFKTFYTPKLSQARRLVDKAHSASMREIDSVLNASRQPAREIFVKTQREARPSVCSLAPPKTVTNRFSTTVVPKLDLDPVFGDDLRGVFLTNFPVSERLFGSRSRRFLDSKASIKLKPLSDTIITRDLPEAIVTSRPVQKLGMRGFCCFVVASC